MNAVPIESISFKDIDIGYEPFAAAIRSIGFDWKMGMSEDIQAYFVTPGGERVEIFGHGGGRAEAARQSVPFLGEIPLFTEIRVGGDQGRPVVVSAPEQPPGQAFVAVAKGLRERLE